MEKKKEKCIVHVGRYHRKDDIRIFCKECNSLLNAGYRVCYVTSDVYGDKGQCEVDGIQIGFYENKNFYLSFRRDILQILNQRKKWIDEVVDYILSFNPDVVHIHEYEIIFVARPLLKRNRNLKIVYDIHEDNPRQQGEWYRRNKGERTARIAEKIVECKERRVIKKSAIVFSATDYISALISPYHKNVHTVRNYPKSDDIICSNDDLKERENIYCYSGGITEDRGISLLTKNSDAIKGKFLRAGNMEKTYQDALAKEYTDKWNSNVEYKGYLTREQINGLYSQSVVGMCTLQFQPNYINALPIKMFEYMAAGIPVVCSNFPLWKKIVEDAECGIAVDPYDEKAIVEAVNLLLGDRDLAKRLGDNGQKAIREKYNWEHEAATIVNAYKNI